jgi:hypothetical protein
LASLGLGAGDGTRKLAGSRQAPPPPPSLPPFYLAGTRGTILGDRATETEIKIETSEFRRERGRTERVHTSRACPARLGPATRCRRHRAAASRGCVGRRPARRRSARGPSQRARDGDRHARRGHDDMWCGRGAQLLLRTTAGRALRARSGWPGTGRPDGTGRREESRVQPTRFRSESLACPAPNNGPARSFCDPDRGAYRDSDHDADRAPYRGPGRDQTVSRTVTRTLSERALHLSRVGQSVVTTGPSCAAPGAAPVKSRGATGPGRDNVP